MEWEKAARGTNEKLFVWGSKFNHKYANFGNKVLPIGITIKDTSPYGLFDMNGNVSEWTSSWYQPYPGFKFKDKLFGKGPIAKFFSENALNELIKFRKELKPCRKIFDFHY